MDVNQENLVSPLTIFYSYAHEDKALLDELEKHLGVLRRQGLISAWHDCDIQAGKEWRSQINVYLNTADIVLLLVSPDFIVSDYCYSVEMHRAWERHKAGEACVIPIILRPVDLEGLPIRELQMLPRDGTPITGWHNRDEAFLDVARGIREAARAIQHQKTKEQGGKGAIMSSHTQHSLQVVNTDEYMARTPYKIINTKEAVNLFHSFMLPKSSIRVLRIVGKGKMGKSHLLTKVFPELARRRYQAPCAILDLRNPVYTAPDILQIASNQLGNQVRDSCSAAYEAWMNHPVSPDTEIKDIANKSLYLTFHFVQALTKLEDGFLLLFFDSVDSAPKKMQTWLMDILLAQLSPLRHVRVVLAGRSLPKANASYATSCCTYQLFPISDEQAYIDYCHNLKVDLAEQSIRDFAYACDYIPGVFTDLVLPKFVPQEIVDG